MGLFSKSKKVNEYEEASNNLNNEATTLASERVIFEQIQDDDERAAFLVDQMKLGSPLIINFENCVSDKESKQGQTVDALALGGDEGRDKLR